MWLYFIKGVKGRALREGYKDKYSEISYLSANFIRVIIGLLFVVGKISSVIPRHRTGCVDRRVVGPELVVN